MEKQPLITGTGIYYGGFKNNDSIIIMIDSYFTASFYC